MTISLLFSVHGHTIAYIDTVFPIVIAVPNLCQPLFDLALDPSCALFQTRLAGERYKFVISRSQTDEGKGYGQNQSSAEGNGED
jgi:hypothetical protein